MTRSQEPRGSGDLQTPCCLDIKGGVGLPEGTDSTLSPFQLFSSRTEGLRGRDPVASDQETVGSIPTGDSGDKRPEILRPKGPQAPCRLKILGEGVGIPEGTDSTPSPFQLSSAPGKALGGGIQPPLTEGYGTGTDWGAEREGLNRVSHS